MVQAALVTYGEQQTRDVQKLTLDPSVWERGIECASAAASERPPSITPRSICRGGAGQQ